MQIGGATRRFMSRPPAAILSAPDWNNDDRSRFSQAPLGLASDN